MTETLPWPRPLCVQPLVVVITIAALIALAWVLFLALDIFGLVRLPGDQVAWRLLFNDRPVEWAQWLLQGAAILTAGFIAGRLIDAEDHGIRAFLLLIGAGLVLMLFEDAGDARHVISAHVQAVFGPTVMGISYRVVSDVPYFMVIAALPLYAIVRYGRDAWRARMARPYLVAGYGLYALAGGASGIRHLGDFYISLGATVDRLLFGGRFPVPDSLSQERAHFMIIDSVFEESLETMAAVSLLAAVLAIGHDIRAGRLLPPRRGHVASAGSAS